MLVIKRSTKILRKADGGAEPTNVARKKPAGPPAPGGGSGSGEGSRGGHVVGHAPGGAPEYQKTPRLSEQIGNGKVPSPPGADPVKPSDPSTVYRPASMRQQGPKVNQTISQHAPTPDSFSQQAEAASSTAQSANHPDAEIAAAKAHEQAAAAHHSDANKVQAKYHAQMAVMHRRVATVMQSQAKPAPGAPPAGPGGDSSQAPTRVSAVQKTPQQGDGGTVAGRAQVKPEQRGQQAPQGAPPSDLSEPAENGEKSKEIADEHLKSKSAGTTPQGTEAKLGADYSKMDPKELDAVSKLHRAAQEHLLNAAKQTGDAKYKEAAKKHLDEEFKASSSFVHHGGGGAASKEHGHDLGKPMEKALSFRSKFIPVAAWIEATDVLAKSDFHKRLDPFAALGMLGRLQKATQGDLFGGAKPQTDPTQAPTAAGSVHSAATHAVRHGGGEGSRGGHVVGHTGSGKPIYESHSHESHAGFTSQDHADAAKRHEDIANDHEGPVEDYAGHDEAHHRAQSKAHKASGEVRFREEAKTRAIGHSKRAMETSRVVNSGGNGGRYSHVSAQGHHLQAASSQRIAGRHDLASVHEDIAKQHAEKAKDATEKTRVAEAASLKAKSSKTAAADHSRAASAHHAAAAARGDWNDAKRMHVENAKGHEERAKELSENPFEKRARLNPHDHEAQAFASAARLGEAQGVADARSATANHPKTGGMAQQHDKAAEAHAHAASVATAEGDHKAADEHRAIAKTHREKGEASAALGAKTKPTISGSDNLPKSKGRVTAPADFGKKTIAAANAEEASRPPGIDHANRAVELHNSIQNLASMPTGRGKDARATRSGILGQFGAFKGHVEEHHKAVPGGNIEAYSAANEAHESAKKAAEYASQNTGAGDKAAGHHVKEARRHARRAMTLVRNHSAYKKSLVDTMMDLQKAFTPSTTLGSPYAPKPSKKIKKPKFTMTKPPTSGDQDPRSTGGLKRPHAPVTKSIDRARPIDAMIETLEKSMTHVKTETLQPKKGNKKAGKKAKVKGGARGHVASDPGSPSPGKTEHLAPMSVQGALTKSNTPSNMDNFAAAYAVEGVEDRYRHRPRLARPVVRDMWIGGLPQHGGAEPVARMEKSEASKYAQLAVDHALKDSWRKVAAQTNQGSLQADMLLKSVSASNGRPTWTPDQRATLNPTFIEPDSHVVVRTAADLLKGLAANDPDAALGLEALGASERSLMDRLASMNLNVESVVFA